MLENINETKNIVIPFTPYNDSVQVQAGGVLAWSGWVLVYKSVNEGESNLKTRYNNFKLATV